MSRPPFTPQEQQEALTAWRRMTPEKRQDALEAIAALTSALRVIATAAGPILLRIAANYASASSRVEAERRARKADQ